MVKELIAGRYRPLERHAVGGMSSIWRAHDEWTGETVAVKRLHPFLVSDPVARERLIREAAALRALDHPSIVRPREVIDDPADPALVMDFATGRSLQSRLAETGPLNADEAVGIMTAVADALAVAHGAGIVHRDIKPANILVDQSGAVQVVDFGIVAMPAGAEALTAPQTMVGTLRYAAPERLAGHEATPRSDVWALGALLYELLTGRPAVADPTAARRLDHAPPADTVDLPATLRAIVDRAMATDPADRYGHAGEFRDALADAGLDAEPTAETVIVHAPVRPTALSSALSPGLAALAPAPSWSPVDRAAAGFIAVVALAVILAVAAIGFDGLGAVGGSPSSTDPAISRETPVPAPTSVPVTAAPDDDDGEGRGNGNGRGKDNDKGKGNGSD